MAGTISGKLDISDDALTRAGAGGLAAATPRSRSAWCLLPSLRTRRQFLVYDGQVSSQLGAHLLPLSFLHLLQPSQCRC